MITYTPLPSLRHIADLVELGLEMHNESQFNVYKYNPFKVESMCLHARAHNDWLLLTAIDDKTDKAVGVIIGYITDYWAGDGLMAEDKALFVTKNARGVAIAKRLLEGYTNWATGKGVQQVYMMHSTGHKAEAGAKFFEKVGLEQIGTVHRTNVTPPQGVVELLRSN